MFRRSFLEWLRFTVYIINKSGGLIFYEDYGSAVRMDTNDSLRSASLWHSMHAISQHYRRLWVAQGSNSLKRMHSISVASNHSLVCLDFHLT
ncbi:hypothetical protein CK203_021323 [Vitis vinifera]|uniref:Trafficking protein particle complex subunit n=1 Tax=Vitis vinifera TaxID=29760 RepID=A0A438IMK8_VITVI|nr:hypothetical protein CK203_108635 [Vitis vinifera]RVW97952.1 hypothetical protein CK203_021323 [Vitis vinifera]